MTKSAPQYNLEDILLALQKSFSRVSSESNQDSIVAKHGAEAARALIFGPVHFDLDLKLEPRDGDYLRYEPKGALSLKLSGIIEQDIGIKNEQAAKTEKEESNNGHARNEE